MEGVNYFCNSVASADIDMDSLYPDNALWDGQDHLIYRLNNPPWFYKTLPETTTDDIELCMCFSKHLSSIRKEKTHLKKAS